MQSARRRQSTTTRVQSSDEIEWLTQPLTTWRCLQQTQGRRGREKQAHTLFLHMTDGSYPSTETANSAYDPRGVSFRRGLIRRCALRMCFRDLRAQEHAENAGVEYKRGEKNLLVYIAHLGATIRRVVMAVIHDITEQHSSKTRSREFVSERLSRAAHAADEVRAIRITLLETPIFRPGYSRSSSSYNQRVGQNGEE